MGNNELPIYSIIAIVAVVGLIILFTGEIANNEITGEGWGRRIRRAYTPPPTTTTTTTPSVILSCTDSDGGLEYFTPGTLTYGDATTNDKCEGDTLLEGYCRRNRQRYKKFLCPDGCTTTNGIGHCKEAPTQVLCPGADQNGWNCGYIVSNNLWDYSKERYATYCEDDGTWRASLGQFDENCGYTRGCDSVTHRCNPKDTECANAPDEGNGAYTCIDSSTQQYCQDGLLKTKNCGSGNLCVSGQCVGTGNTTNST